MSERRGRRAMVEGVASLGIDALASASLLVACGSSPSSMISTASGSGDASLKLDQLNGQVKVAQKSTFLAEYAATSGGSTLTITLAVSVLSAVISIYNGSAALAVIKAWPSSIAAHLAGVSLTFSDKTIAGQHATCAHWSHSGDQAIYCVTTNGILAKVQSSSSSSGGESFQLTSYTISPPCSAFAIPQNARIITIPTGAWAP